MEETIRRAFAQLRLDDSVAAKSEEKLLLAPIQMSTSAAEVTSASGGGAADFAPSTSKTSGKKGATIPTLAPKEVESDDVRVFAQVQF